MHGQIALKFPLLASRGVSLALGAYFFGGLLMAIGEICWAGF
jgi:hypothetical protein